MPQGTRPRNPRTPHVARGVLLFCLPAALAALASAAFPGRIVGFGRLLGFLAVAALVFAIVQALHAALMDGPEIVQLLMMLPHFVPVGIFALLTLIAPPDWEPSTATATAITVAVIGCNVVWVVVSFRHSSERRRASRVEIWTPPNLDGATDKGGDRRS